MNDDKPSGAANIESAADPAPPTSAPPSQAKTPPRPDSPAQPDSAKPNAHRRFRLSEWINAGSMLAVAILTVGLVVVGSLQWHAMDGQLRVMRSDESGAAAQLSATEALASDTRQVASAAASEARAASDQDAQARIQASSLSAMALEAQNQLAALRQSVAVAGKAAGSAGLANSIAMKIQRAYVYPVQGQFNFTFDGTTQYWHIAPRWENSGPTPPVHFITETACVHPPHPVHDPLKGDTFVHTVGQRSIGPHESQLGVACGFNNNAMAALLDHSVILYMVMRADYDDVFDHHHRFEECMWFNNMAANLTTPTGPPEISYQGVPCETHQCADDDCPPSNWADAARASTTKNAPTAVAGGLR